jgi:hypothetical protein
MDNVVCVTVVDTLQNLLHQNSGVFLSEFSPGDNFIEEFTTLANPSKIWFRIIS